MIAWTSPLRTVRSMPARISRVGSATGTTCRSRMTSVAVVGCPTVTRSAARRRAARGHAVVMSVVAGRSSAGRSCSGRRRVVRVARPGRRQVGQGDRVERADDGVADADPEQVHVAEAGAAADAGVDRILARADHGRDRALERLDDLAHPDLGGVAGELVAAVGAARAGDEARLAKADDQLLEVRPRQVLVVGHLGQADRARRRGGGPARPSAARRTRRASRNAARHCPERSSGEFAGRARAPLQLPVGRQLWNSE